MVSVQCTCSFWKYFILLNKLLLGRGREPLLIFWMLPICSSLNIRARWDFQSQNHDPAPMYFNVKLNFKASLFSSTFWFERSFRWGNAILVFWPSGWENSSKTVQKNAILKNWPKIHSKVINAWIKCLVYHFGGCFAGFLESVLTFGRPKCHFLALKNGHFWQKCPLSSAKKWHFERPSVPNSTGGLRGALKKMAKIGLLDQLGVGVLTESQLFGQLCQNKNLPCNWP